LALRDDNVSSTARIQKYGQAGFGFEKQFEQQVKEFGFHIERGDQPNKRNPDFIVSIRIDCKKRHTPLLKAKSLVGIDPDKCVMVDMNKINAYIATGDNVLILFDVDYRPQFDTVGQWVITTNKVKKIIDQGDPKRKKTFFDYEKKKDIERFYMSIDEMVPFSELTKLFV